MATTPLFLPGEAHGERNLAGYSPCGHTDSGLNADCSTPGSLAVTVSEFAQIHVH